VELERAIRRRRMTRSFQPTPLPGAVVAELLDLARRAPSAGYSQGVSFLVLRDAAETAAFWDVSGGRAWWTEQAPGTLAAPVLVLPLADAAVYTARYSEPDKAGHGLDDAANWPVPFWLTDAAMAAMNLLLAAEARGLGALFFGIFGDEREVLRRFGVPDGVRTIGAIALGYRAADDHPSGSPTTHPRRPLDELVHWGTWGRAT
jgi:nitroreductase